MHTVIRNYVDAPGFAADLRVHGKEIESVARAVPGFIAFYLLETSNGATSITVCETRAGCEESTRRASEWLRKSMPNLKLSAPQVIVGELALRFANYPTKVRV